MPGRPGYETNQQILDTYGDGGAADPLVLVVTLPEGTTVDSPGVRAELADTFARIVAATGQARVVSYPGTGDRGLVSADGRTTFALLYPPASPAFPPYAQSLPALESALADARVAGAPVRLTGTDALFVQSSEASGPGLLAEITIAGLRRTRRPRGGVRLRPGGPAAPDGRDRHPGDFLAVWGLTAVTDVSFVVQFLVGLIGLGVAIDYALLITTRWREERANGADNITAVERAMATAGSAVVFSGVTVAVALAALIVLPVPFLRSMGYGGLLIPLFSVLVATTLLPVLLAAVGPRLDWPRARVRRSQSRRQPSTLGLERLGAAGRRPSGDRGRRRDRALAALVVPVFGLRLGAPTPAAMASSGPRGKRSTRWRRPGSEPVC